MYIRSPFSNACWARKHTKTLQKSSNTVFYSGYKAYATTFHEIQSAQRLVCIGSTFNNNTEYFSHFLNYIILKCSSELELGIKVGSSKELPLLIGFKTRTWNLLRKLGLRVNIIVEQEPLGGADSYWTGPLETISSTKVLFMELTSQFFRFWNLVLSSFQEASSLSLCLMSEEL